MFNRVVLNLAVSFFLSAIAVSAFAQGGYETATFSGGCFWSMQKAFEKLPGIIKDVAGYTGGKETNPTYQEVETGDTGHLEAVQITYDPAQISYSRLLDIFWRNIDPTDDGGQFVDRGSQYRTAIFYHNDEQQRLAEQSKDAFEKIGKFGKPIVTRILPATSFYPAEEYHQRYYKKNPLSYEAYRRHSGRDQYFKKIWGDDWDVKESGKKWEHQKLNKEELRKKLTPLQYNVTQENGTEPAFHNSYWANKKAGIYVDIVSGEPLFSSTDKYESHTGWPSFTRPLEPGNIEEKGDNGFGETRTEVRSLHGDSHLGHIFNDGPAPAGLRYCINSASLRFIPKEDLEKEGYGEYQRLFENSNE